MNYSLWQEIENFFRNDYYRDFEVHDSWKLPTD